MKRCLLPVVAAFSFGLTGCASGPHPLFIPPEDSSPKSLDTTDSFALQTLKSGYENVPFNIKDAELPEGAEYNVLSYGTMGTLGLLSSGVFGAMGGLGLSFFMNSSTHPAQEQIHYIAWIPADNMDIKDVDSIHNYLLKNYFNPALESFVESDLNKGMAHPTEIVDNSDLEVKVKGDSCWPVTHGADKESRYETCQILWKPNVVPQNYATVESGIPFTPEVKASRYIVVRITDGSYRTVGVLPHLKSNMIYAYVPAVGYKVDQPHLGRFFSKDEPVVFSDIPYVIGKDKTPNFFIKKEAN